MSNTYQRPETDDERNEVQTGERLVKALVGSVITGFGANEQGEILLHAEKDGVETNCIFAIDEEGDIALYEI